MKKIKVRLPDGSTVDADDAGYVDLDAAEVFDERGERVTEDRVGREVERIESGRGRPSLTGRGDVSPHVSFRLPADLRALAEQRARAEGKSLSALAREALENWLRAA